MLILTRRSGEALSIRPAWHYLREELLAIPPAGLLPEWRAKPWPAN